MERVAAALALDDAKRLAAALAEVAAEEVNARAAFAERVRARYALLGEKPAKPARATTATGAAPKPRVAAGRAPGHEIDVVPPLDPRSLIPLYGDALPNRLAAYSVRALWQMAKLLAPDVGEKAPPLKSGHDVMLAYVLRHVQGVRVMPTRS
jgi:hypothetical protein